MYRIQTPQTPIVRTKRYKEYHMDEFPSGTNMIVAVLAYTGVYLCNLTMSCQCRRLMATSACPWVCLPAQSDLACYRQ